LTSSSYWKNERDATGLAVTVVDPFQYDIENVDGTILPAGHIIVPLFLTS
tara:strand:+ start:2056 stop:2205 length:150 start_codon:yes stop_codon:yes gene_type:complete